MAGYRDPWVMLGIDRSADDREIKKAYRQLARQYHPDRNPGDDAAAAMFQDIARAFEQIDTETKRALWLSQHEAAPATGTGGSFGPLGEDFYDTFGEQPVGAPRRNRDASSELRQTVKISFQQAYTGATLEFPLEVEDACPTCGGSGAAPGHKPRMCNVCRGTGEHTVGRVSSKCAVCQGNGFTIEFPCSNCVGGLVKDVRPVVIQIPAGIVDGQTMRVPGPRQGRLGAPSLLVTVRVEPSQIFKRLGNSPADLLIDIPVSYTEACLGAEVRIPTPEKPLRMHIPEGTPSGKRFRFANMGMVKDPASGERGDLYARVSIAVPPKISSPQRKLIAQLGHYDNEEDLRAELWRQLR